MGETYISSRTNPTVVMLASLQSKKGRCANGLYLCEGRKLCAEAAGRCTVRYTAVKESCDTEDLRAIASKAGGELIVLSDGAFDKISSDTSPDGLIFAVEMLENNGFAENGETVFALECVRDPGNVGTVIRTAAAFGIDRLILADCADIYNPKTVRASMGALFKMKFTVCGELDEIIPMLKKQGRRVISTALAGDSMSLSKTVLHPSDCIIVGNEGHGIKEETVRISDGTMIIPMTDKTESLNAATASAVLLWEMGKVIGKL